MKRTDTEDTGPVGRHIDPLPHQVRFARASESLARYLAGYHDYLIESAPGARFEEIFFPAWANIRFQLSGEHWAMRIAGVRFDPIPPASLFGPTGYAGFSEFGRGQILGVGITPCGWARLIGGDASALVDQIVPLTAILGDTALVLHADIAAAASFEDRVQVLDAFLQARLDAAPPEPAEIHRIQELLVDPQIGTIEEVIAAIDMPRWRFNRLCRRYFGFPPKRLLRRARFMRTMMALRTRPDLDWIDLLDPQYHDQSHFIRDCRDFVGMTPGQVLARAQPVGATSMAERTRILGAPVQALQRDGD